MKSMKRRTEKTCSKRDKGDQDATRSSSLRKSNRPRPSAKTSEEKGKRSPPRWTDATGNLVWHGVLLIHLERQAYAERCILAEFEKNNWASLISNPLVKAGHANYAKRRRNAVHQLNKHHAILRKQLARIRFLSLGKGAQIGWIPLT